MSPDDHRHGTYAGAVAHWFSDNTLCGPCWTAQDRYRKRRKLAALAGHRATYPSHIVTRRVQALQALGWTGPQIAADAGLSLNTIRSVTYHQAANVRAVTAEPIIATYARLCMTRPEGRYADRSRNMARRRGWAPPLCWDDIDDLDETPVGIYVKPTTPAEWLSEHAAKRVADLEHAIDHGRTLEQAAETLEMTVDGLIKWCQRKERDDLLAALQRRSRKRDLGRVA